MLIGYDFLGSKSKLISHCTDMNYLHLLAHKLLQMDSLMAPLNSSTMAEMKARESHLYLVTVKAILWARLWAVALDVSLAMS